MEIPLSSQFFCSLHLVLMSNRKSEFLVLSAFTPSSVWYSVMPVWISSPLMHLRLNANIYYCFWLISPPQRKKKSHRTIMTIRFNSVISMYKDQYGKITYFLHFSWVETFRLSTFPGFNCLNANVQLSNHCTNWQRYHSNFGLLQLVWWALPMLPFPRQDRIPSPWKRKNVYSCCSAEQLMFLLSQTGKFFILHLYS